MKRIIIPDILYSIICIHILYNIYYSFLEFLESLSKNVSHNTCNYATIQYTNSKYSNNYKKIN